jgi:hypothetical protein
MELIGFEESKVIYLFDLLRPAGQIYSPEAAAKLVQRYSFTTYPSLENLVKNERQFGVGKFGDIGIQQFSIYGDGVIATSGSDTDKIDAFVDDILAWSKEEFGLVQLTAGNPPERSYESTIIVQAKVDLTRVLAPKPEVLAVLNKIYQSDRYISGPVRMAGFIAATDRTKFPGRRKPISFTLDHRVGVPFENNVFFSMAPLRTKDHLAFLRSLEDLASL